MWGGRQCPALDVYVVLVPPPRAGRWLNVMRVEHATAKRTREAVRCGELHAVVRMAHATCRAASPDGWPGHSRDRPAAPRGIHRQRNAYAAAAAGEGGGSERRKGDNEGDGRSATQ